MPLSSPIVEADCAEKALLERAQPFHLDAGGGGRGVSGPGVPWLSQFLADQLTLFQPGGQIIPAPPYFWTVRRLCVVFGKNSNQHCLLWGQSFILSKSTNFIHIFKLFLKLYCPLEVEGQAELLVSKITVLVILSYCCTMESPIDVMDFRKWIPIHISHQLELFQ